MSSEDEEDDPKPEKLPIYRKGKEIFDIVNKIAALIPENNEYLMEVKSQMMCDAALLFVKVAGAEAQSFKKSYPLALTRASHTVAPLSHCLVPKKVDIVYTLFLSSFSFLNC